MNRENRETEKQHFMKHRNESEQKSSTHKNIYKSEKTATSLKKDKNVQTTVKRKNVCGVLKVL